MFLQATPGIARMLSQPSAYDYAIIEGDRLLIAKEGIELEADYVFDSTGHKIPVDKFHPAELIYQKEMEQVEQKLLRIKQDENNIKEKRMAAMSSYVYSPVISKSV
jgi:ribulose 1,5-bisphosphate synthetase/thiazole synthase